MTYQFKKSSYIKANAQIAGEMCERLAEDNNLSAKSLLEANRPDGAPLHDAFEWNDSVAAESWREQQARHIINSLEIVVEGQEPIRAYFNIVRTEPEYRHIETILQRQDTTQALLLTAWRELQAFEKKYKQLEQLSGVFAAIENLKIAQ